MKQISVPYQDSRINALFRAYTYKKEFYHDGVFYFVTGLTTKGRFDDTRVIVDLKPVFVVGSEDA